MMNDYKELVYSLRASANLASECFTSQLRDFLEKKFTSAADAIEQLVKERGAAVADLRNAIADDFSLSQCHYCKYQEEDGQCHHDCIMFSPKWGWEWRGVKEVEHEVD